jgi:hypothetical protein
MLIFGAIRAGSLGYMARLLAEYVTCTRELRRSHVLFPNVLILVSVWNP